MTFRQLDETILVSPAQVRPEDMAEIAALGVTTVINNRPDAEEPVQPSSAEVEAAARAAGLDYRHIPFSSGSRSEIEAMAEALDAGPALAFCRSGTRSTYLWALARASRGADPAALARQAAEAGYDLSPILRLLAR